MAILVINPNSTQSMTQMLVQEYQKLDNRCYGVQFETCAASPASIEGYSDGALAAYEVIQLIKRYEMATHDQPEAYIIACFDDTGLHAARELTRQPVFGIGESAMHAATLLSSRFCIMTTLQRSVPIIEQNVSAYGLANRCSGVFASGVSVLQLDEDPNAYAQVLKKAQEKLQETHGEALVLGCAGMSHWVEKMEQDLQMPILDGFRISIKLAEAFVSLQLKTSKVNAYRYPEKNTNDNTFSRVPLKSFLVVRLSLNDPKRKRIVQSG